MISQKIEEALNNQINEEIFSYYLYLSMQAYFEHQSLSGFANWMNLQAREEQEHAMRIFRYIIDRGGRIHLEKIEKPKSDWNSPLNAFEEAYEHEQHITSTIHKLVDLATEENDRATTQMLDWFIEEQVEEEATTEEIVDKLNLIGDSGSGLLAIDRELGQRKSTD